MVGELGPYQTAVHHATVDHEAIAKIKPLTNAIDLVGGVVLTTVLGPLTAVQSVSEGVEQGDGWKIVGGVVELGTTFFGGGGGKAVVSAGAKAGSAAAKGWSVGSKAAALGGGGAALVAGAQGGLKIVAAVGQSQLHHIATNKHRYWTPPFIDLFKDTGVQLSSMANQVYVAGHYGPHPAVYHKIVYDVLQRAKETGGAEGLREPLAWLGGECRRSDSKLNTLITNSTP